jgi:anti-anti-sigma factor
LAREPGTQVYRDLAEHPDDQQPDGVAVVRLDGGLFFATADALEDRVRALIQETPNLTGVVIDLEGVNFVDSQGSAKVDDILILISDLRKQGYSGTTIACTLTPLSRLFTHAVRRRSALVDGHPMPKSAPAEAPARALECAERVLTGAQALTGVPPNDYLYGRVDLAPSGADFLLLELELIEPSLFLLHAPAAAESYAEALLSS